MLMNLCLVVVTILISVPSSPNAPRPTSPMPHHLIIVDTDVVFPLPNSRLYHNQRKANIPVSSATTLMCSSSCSMKDLIKPLMGQPCLHVCTLFPPHRICIVYNTRWLPGFAQVPYYAPSPCHFIHLSNNTL